MDTAKFKSRKETKKHTTFQKSQKAIALMTTLGLVFLCAAIYLFLSTSSSYTISNDAFQVVAGEKLNFPSGTSFIYKENGPTYRGAQDDEYLNNSPVYFKDKNKIMIPDDTIYVDARKVNYYRVISFCEIQRNHQLEYKGNFMNGGFLYDGKKTYTFLEDMTLKVNGKKVQLGAFSSITLSSNRKYCLYNTTSKEVSVDEIYSETLIAVTNDYQVDVLNDVLIDKEEQKILLVNRVDILEEYKK